MAKRKPVQLRLLRPLGKQGTVAGKRKRDFQPRLEEVQPGLVLSVSESFNAELQEALELYI